MKGVRKLETHIVPVDSPFYVTTPEECTWVIQFEPTLEKCPLLESALLEIAPRIESKSNNSILLDLGSSKLRLGLVHIAYNKKANGFDADLLRTVVDSVKTTILEVLNPIKPT